MPQRVWSRFVMAGLACLAASGVAAAQPPLPQVVEFNRDIRPILSDNCFACHGPDKNQRKAELRLDTEEGAFADRGDTKVLVPGKAEQSELVRRISHSDEKKRMPPAKFGKRLTDRQIELLRRWVEQGAKWQKHWSLIAAQRPPLPAVDKKHGPRNAIDFFVLARLEHEKIEPAAEADRRALVRRLAFDLTGLPPTPAEVEAALADQSADWYEKVVDRLLASKHYGERLALYWLDLVRYADTGGYHSDNHREVSLYRDYVIKAFNSNKRFDRFTAEQLAGDLLPDAGAEQKIASGYNRLLMTTEEGGAQAKEYTAKYAADRVRNVSSVWLGTTLGCTECHDHKFDPFTTKEFYRFGSFFADVRETAVGRQPQDQLPTAEQAAKLKDLTDAIAGVQKVLATQTPELDAALVKWEEAVKKGDNKGIPKNILDIVAVEAEKRSVQQKQALATHYRTIAPLLEESRQKLADLQKQKAELDKTIATTLVTTSVSPRMMRVLPRGNWLDDSGEIVAPGTPASLPPLGVEGRRATRLDLANWMVKPENPLVARVFVNRLWKLFCGQGIVKSLEDFGSQGTAPTHPELLDWLAVEFRESGWDVKHMVRLMVLARTYRQVSTVKPDIKEHDPYNRLLARQARFRLDAEMVRDNSLAVGGLLVRTIGGGSVKPYQPAGYWAMLNFPKREWDNSKGEELYRRSLYTYWCRTFPYPSLVTFDAPSREECVVERPRSNTPLQALVLLNDPTYVEAARAFAERLVREGGKEPADRIQFAYRQALQRRPEAAEVQVVQALFQKHLEQYRANPKAATELLAVGDKPVPKDIDAAELAAWTSVARVVLNLHETITRN
jgi:mono/diheme cytochrome c family protein